MTPEKLSLVVMALRPCTSLTLTTIQKTTIQLLLANRSLHLWFNPSQTSVRETKAMAFLTVVRTSNLEQLRVNQASNRIVISQKKHWVLCVVVTPWTDSTGMVQDGVLKRTSTPISYEPLTDWVSTNQNRSTRPNFATTMVERKKARSCLTL